MNRFLDPNVFRYVRDAAESAGQAVSDVFRPYGSPSSRQEQENEQDQQRWRGQQEQERHEQEGSERSINFTRSFAEAAQRAFGGGGSGGGGGGGRTRRRRQQQQAAAGREEAPATTEGASMRIPPASSRAIRQLPTILVQPEDLIDPTNRECCICLEDIHLHSKAIRLPCAHIYHKGCVVDWLSNHHCTCPVCRYELPTDNPLYEVARKERMKCRKPRFARYELERMSVSELGQIVGKCPSHILDKQDWVNYLIARKGEIIDIIETPPPTAEYTVGQLQQMKISQLKSTMNDAGVFFDPKDVVEKQDMISIFVNSGRLLLIQPPEVDQQTNQHQTHTNAKTTPYNVETVQSDDEEDNNTTLHYTRSLSWGQRVHHEQKSKRKKAWLPFNHQEQPWDSTAVMVENTSYSQEEQEEQEQQEQQEQQQQQQQEQQEQQQEEQQEEEQQEQEQEQAQQQQEQAQQQQEQAQQQQEQEQEQEEQEQEQEQEEQEQEQEEQEQQSQSQSQSRQQSQSQQQSQKTQQSQSQQQSQQSKPKPREGQSQQSRQSQQPSQEQTFQHEEEKYSDQDLSMVQESVNAQQGQEERDYAVAITDATYPSFPAAAASAAAAATITTAATATAAAASSSSSSSSSYHVTQVATGTNPSESPQALHQTEQPQLRQQQHNKKNTKSNSHALDFLTISELRALARQLQIDLSDCIEKKEMMDRLFLLSQNQQQRRYYEQYEHQCDSTNQSPPSSSNTSLALFYHNYFRNIDWSISELRTLAKLIQIDVSNCHDQEEILQSILITACHNNDAHFSHHSTTSNPNYSRYVLKYCLLFQPLCGLSVSQLHMLAYEWNVPIQDCIEKGDVIYKLLSHRTNHSSFNHSNTF